MILILEARIMSVLHRFLSKDTTTNTVCESIDCMEEWRDLGYCGSICLNNCPSICKIIDLTVLSPPPVQIHPDLDHHLKKILIISASSIITTLFLLTLLVLCFKYYTRRRSRTISRRWSMEEAIGPSPVIVDHPVWHIRTIGLNPTVISSIKVCKYSKRDGVVEGTDCSVCLSEFEEEEMLRLLPKCRHAFHLSCIDTWLRSHNNCPLCRAPIVMVDRDDVEEILVSIPEGNGEMDEENERDHVEEVDELEQRVRRSVSLDSLSGLRVSEGVGGRGKEKVKSIGPSVVGRSGFLKRSISYNGK